jgi:hypothetical protein
MDLNSTNDPALRQSWMAHERDYASAAASLPAVRYVQVVTERYLSVSLKGWCVETIPGVGSFYDRIS